MRFRLQLHLKRGKGFFFYFCSVAKTHLLFTTRYLLLKAETEIAFTRNYTIQGVPDARFTLSRDRISPTLCS